MELDSEIYSTHFRKSQDFFGMECDLSILLNFVTDDEDLTFRIYNSVLEGNYVSIEELNGVSFDQHEKDLVISTKSSVCKYLLNVVETLLESDVDITEKDIHNELENTLLSASIDLNRIEYSSDED